MTNHNDSLSDNRAMASMSLVKRALECPICLEPFSNPKLLSCNHSYVNCLILIELYIKNPPRSRCCEVCIVEHACGNPLVIACPVCRIDTILKGSSAAEGAATLPKNYAINSVVEALAQEERLAQATRCQECVDEPPADWRCEVCAVVMCNECCIQHSRAKASAAHQTCNIATPSIKGPPKATTMTRDLRAAVAVPNLCVDDGEPHRIYCNTHTKLICMYAIDNCNLKLKVASSASI